MKYSYMKNLVLYPTSLKNSRWAEEINEQNLKTFRY